MSWHMLGATHGAEGQWRGDWARVEVVDGQSRTVEKQIVDLAINWTDDRQNQDRRIVVNAHRAYDYALQFPPTEG